MSNLKETIDTNFLSRFKDTNITNNDKDEKQAVKQPCKYFNTKTGCKNGAMCKFLHESIENWRSIIKVKLSPEEEIREEIKFAIINRSLNDIFKKMVTSNDDYQKYYSEMEKQFRGVATWKLIKRSIKTDLINTIHSKNVELDDGILPYGYIPLCLFFIFSGLSWKIFDGASDNVSQFEIESYIDEVIDIVSGMYSNEDYRDIIKTVTLYCNPSTYATLGHIVTSNLCDTIMSHIKNQLSPEDFNTFLEQKTNKDETLRDWFEENKENNNEKNMQRYKWKYENLIKNARGNTDKLALAKKIYDYNIAKITHKSKIFSLEIFNISDTVIQRKVFISSQVDYDKLFNTELSNLLLSENRFGKPYNQQIFIKLINWIRMYFNMNDEKINIIFSKIPSNLCNSDQLIKQCKEYKCIQNLWTYILSTISFDTPFSYCSPILNEFFKEINIGIREAYIGEYIHKVQFIYNSLTSENKILFINNIMSSSILDEIKCLFKNF
jgi:hypothetical protein